MNRVILSLAVGASALLATAASAAPLTRGIAVAPDNGIQNVRVVCDQYGRCFNRDRREVVVQEQYGYAPRERYIERRGYSDRGYYDDGYRSGPSVGIGIGPGGVGVGVGAW